ncbi:metallophosphoesterase [Cellulomonas cellasea]|uniref:Icc-related predicted phosphoesterase n=1 Tax=Cellulomonas cellasea TaxID=43670 RepID=A0A7W4UBY3_9CELL|nr:metallophosphoesterase [Cellulomonas cellasea]MBB2921366.1 Icc-related predicted phosphoesterase [Cellulomonas cellasea]
MTGPDPAAHATADDAPAREDTAPRLPAWLRLGVPALLVLLGALVFGVTTATADLSLGPHEARYDVTTDGTVTLDLGPLGTLEIDSPVPLGLGARVTVQEIPSGVTAVDPATTLTALSSDLQGYLQFFAGPQATLQDAVRALVTDALWRTLGALAAVTVLVVLGRALLGHARRDELAAALAPQARRLVAGGTVVAVGLGVLTASTGGAARGSQPVASAVFAGTPLEGARVTGRLGGVIDTYGSYAVEAYRSNTEFYARAEDSLGDAWAERSARIEAAQAEHAEQAAFTVPGEAAGTPGSTAPASPSASDAPGAPGGATGPSASPGTADAPASPSPSPTATSTPTADAREDDDATEPVVLVLVSDLHCNVGMAPVIRSLVELAGADVLLDGGDTTIDGTAVEQYCVTTFARAAGGVPVVVSPGNHDSRETEAAYRRAGATVLGGEVVEVAGVRILGDRDPRETRIGAGTSPSSAESPSEARQRLADVACEDERVDLLLIHTPPIGDAALERGCVPAQLSGHKHVRSGPEQVGAGIRFVSASTAGAAPGQPTVGPLRSTAELTVLRFDPDEARLLDYQLVRVGTDAAVSVGPRVAWPRPVPVSAAPDEIAGAAGVPTP